MAKGDLKSTAAIYAKGAAFLGLGIFAAAMLLAEHFSWRSCLLLCIVVWGFCRAYYFAFYVIEHYVDSNYHFAGLIDFARYLIGRPRE
ncbi:MAG: hypothetical protein VXZ82_19310 [Planctomycetota bacterium]|nr:hypothetical protein [Planctomycetota bacterium]